MKTSDIRFPQMVDGDAKAFENVERRLRGDVGPLFGFVDPTGYVPNWVCIRSLFPIAESLAALIYPREASAAKRLIYLFENNLVNYNERYASLSGIITQVWRHGLVHQDEPCSLFLADGSLLMWRLTILEEHMSSHLAVDAVTTDLHPDGEINSTKFEFSIRAFYEDLLSLCSEMSVKFGDGVGSATSTYNGWFLKELRIAGGPQSLPKDKENRPRVPAWAERHAAHQIEAIFKSIRK